MDDIKRDLEAQAAKENPPKKAVKPYRNGKDPKTKADAIGSLTDPGVPSPYAQAKARKENPRKTDGRNHDYGAIKKGRGAGAHGKAPPFKKKNKVGTQKKLPREFRDKDFVLSHASVKKQIEKFAKLSIGQLRDRLREPGTTMIEHMIGSVMVKAAETADAVRFEFLLNRSAGKVKEEKTLEIVPVKYKTEVRPDGSLLQAIIEEESKSLPPARDILRDAGGMDKEGEKVIDAEVTNE